MIIWLRHPSHGIKDCYAEAQAIADEKNGWIRFDPKNDLDKLRYGDSHISLVSCAISNSFEHTKKRGRPVRNK